MEILRPRRCEAYTYTASERFTALKRMGVIVIADPPELKFITLFFGAWLATILFRLA